MQRFIVGPAVPARITDDAIKAGLADAKLGLMQIVTAQLSGDESWLANMDRAALEAKLFEVVADYRDAGRACPSPDCSPIFSKLVGHSGLEMPDEAQMTVRKPMTKKAHDFVMDEMRGYPDEEYSDIPTAAKEKFHVVICGIGVCGLAVAIRLKLAGIPFTVLEKSDSISGTWAQNIYPNVGCDTPSHMYSYSFDPNPNWERYFAKGHENFDYFNRLADKYGVKPFVRLGHEVLSATFDEAAGRWSVDYRTRDGAAGVLSANVYVSGVGQLTIPNIPELPGRRDFRGEQFHTARWRRGVEFEGKNVAIVGTGASCMQVSPTLAGMAKSLTIFQSTPQWMVRIPNYKWEIPMGERWCFAHLPFYERWYRFSLLRHLTDIYEESLTNGSELNTQIRTAFEAYYREQSGGDAELLAKTLPTYPPVCTRLLVDNEWFGMLKRDNVRLVNSRVDRLTETSVVARDGSEAADVDIVVFATGFQSTKFCLPAMRVIGKSGVRLAEYWGDTPSAYLGVAVPQFPNFFMTYGPNTNVGSGGSIVWVAENQARYIAQCCGNMVRENLKTMEVKQETFDRYNLLVDRALAGTAWADTGCQSWYKVGATGKVVNNSPWSLEEYCERVRRLNLDDYLTVTHASEAGAFSPASRAGRSNSNFCRKGSQILTQAVDGART